MKILKHLLPCAGLWLVGCAQSASKEESAEPAAADSAVAVAAPAASPTAALPADVPLARLLRVAGHPVVYQGTMELEVVDFAAASTRLDSVLLGRGAYLAAAHETTDADRHEQKLTIRVPSAQFLALTAGLTRLGIVHSKELTSRDVAAELARLRAAPRPVPGGRTVAADTAWQAARAAQERLLTEQIALATLHLTYYQVRPSTDVAPTEALAKRLQTGFLFGWQAVSTVLVAASYAWPALLLAAGVFWYLRRRTSLS